MKSSSSSGGKKIKRARTYNYGMPGPLPSLSEKSKSPQSAPVEAPKGLPFGGKGLPRPSSETYKTQHETPKKQRPTSGKRSTPLPGQNLNSPYARHVIFRAPLVKEYTQWEPTMCTLEVEFSLYKMLTLCPTPLLMKDGTEKFVVEEGREVELREFIFEERGKKKWFAPVIDQISSGAAMALFDSKVKQNLELTPETHTHTSLHLYKTRRKMKEHKPFRTWKLTNCHVREDEQRKKFYLREMCGTEEFRVKFQTPEAYLAMHFLLSRNRDLSEQERIKRMMGKGYSTLDLIGQAFENIVLIRTAPGARERAAKEDLMQKIYKIDTYQQIINMKTLEDYLQSVKHESLNLREILMLRGALIDEDAEWCLAFIEANGLDNLVKSVESKVKKQDSGIWQIYIVTLEVIEAIMDKEGDESNYIQPGLFYVLANPNVLQFMMKQLKHPAADVRQKVIILLIVLWKFCDNGGLTSEMKTLTSVMHNFSQKEGHKAKWTPLLLEMENELEAFRKGFYEHKSIEHVLNIMRLINLVLKSLDLEERIEEREKMETPKISISELLEDINCAFEEVEEREDIFVKFSDWLDVKATFEESRKEDFRQVTYDNLNFYDVQSVFQYLSTQCEEDGNVDLLSQILRALVSIPRGFHNVWEACSDLCLEAAQITDEKLYKRPRQENFVNLSQVLRRLRERLEADDPGVRLLELEEIVVDLYGQLEEKDNDLEMKQFALEDAMMRDEENQKLIEALTRDKEMLESELLAKSDTMKEIEEEINKVRQEADTWRTRANTVSVSPGLVVKTPPPKPVEPHLDEAYKKMLMMHKLQPPHVFRNTCVKNGQDADEAIGKIEAYKAALKEYEAKMKKYEEIMLMGGSNLPDTGTPNHKQTPEPKVPEPICPEDLAKYIKMMKILPEASLINRMRQDGVKDPEARHVELKMWKEQHGLWEKGELKPPPKKEEEKAPEKKPVPEPVLAEDLKKFVKMMKIMPEASLINRMRQEVKNPEDRYEELKKWKADHALWEKGELVVEEEKKEEKKLAPEPILADDLKKFVKMMKIMPEASMINRMRQEVKNPEDRYEEMKKWKADHALWEKGELFEEEEKPKKKEKKPAPEPILADDLKKFVKMMKIMPEASMINRMRQELKNPEARYEEMKKWKADHALWEKGELFVEEAEDVPAPELEDHLQKYYKMHKNNTERKRLIDLMKRGGVKDPEGSYEKILDYEFALANPGKKRQVKSKKLPLKKMKEAGRNRTETKWTNSTFFMEVRKTTRRAPTEMLFSEEDLNRFLNSPKPSRVNQEEETPEKKRRQRAKKAKKKEEINIVTNMKKLKTLNFLTGSLRRQKITPRDIRNALWSMDSHKLDAEILGQLLPALPSPDEHQLVMAYTGEMKVLNKPSELYYMIRNVPKVELRVNNWLFILQFKEKFKKAKEMIDTMQKAVNAVRNSVGLKAMFNRILEILKVSEKGRIYDGFPLRNLYTVTKKTIDDGKTTWLQYLCRLLNSGEDADVLNYVQELQVLGAIEKIRDIKMMESQMKDCIAGRRRVFNMVKGYKNITVEKGCTDNCSDVMGKFLSSTEAKVQHIEKMMAKVKKDTMSLAEELGENPMYESNVNTEYLKTIWEFVQKTELALKKNKEEDMKKARREKVRLKEEERRRKQQEKKNRKLADQVRVQQRKNTEGETEPQLIVDDPSNSLAAHAYGAKNARESSGKGMIATLAGQVQDESRKVGAIRRRASNRFATTFPQRRKHQSIAIPRHHKSQANIKESLASLVALHGETLPDNSSLSLGLERLLSEHHDADSPEPLSRPGFERHASEDLEKAVLSTTAEHEQRMRGLSRQKRTPSTVGFTNKVEHIDDRLMHAREGQLPSIESLHEDDDSSSGQVPLSMQ